MTTNKTTATRDFVPMTPAQIAARLILLQALILRATSGHAQGGMHRAYRRRGQFRRNLDYRHLFQSQILRGTTAIGIGDTAWLLEIRDLITTLCTDDGIRCWIDPSHAAAGELIAARAASFARDSVVQPDPARLALMREAAELAPTVNPARPTSFPIVIFTPAWADYFGSTGGCVGNDGWLDLIARLKHAGFRVVILCHDVYAFAGQSPDAADYLMPLRCAGDWVFRKLSMALCGYSRPRPSAETGALYGASSPPRLNAAWSPGSSPEVFRLRLLGAFARKRSRRG